jgi:hypothetical protein
VEYPVAALSAQTVLRECAAGKTYRIKPGDTIGIDLEAFGGVDTSRQWSDLSLSDGHVLTTVMAPSRVTECSAMPCPSGFSPQRTDELAVYAGVQAGQSTISAIEQFCGGNVDRCDRGHVWRVNVQVT